MTAVAAGEWGARNFYAALTVRADAGGMSLVDIGESGYSDEASISEIVTAVEQNLSPSAQLYIGRSNCSDNWKGADFGVSTTVRLAVLDLVPDSFS